MKLMNVKGTFDFMPEDMQIRNKIMAIYVVILKRVVIYH